MRAEMLLLLQLYQQAFGQCSKGPNFKAKSWNPLLLTMCEEDRPTAALTMKCKKLGPNSCGSHHQMCGNPQ